MTDTDTAVGNGVVVRTAIKAIQKLTGMPLYVMVSWLGRPPQRTTQTDRDNAIGIGVVFRKSSTH